MLNGIPTGATPMRASQGELKAMKLSTSKSALVLVAAATALGTASAAQAQYAAGPDMAGASYTYSSDIPAEYQTLPDAAGDVEVTRTVADDGTVIETVTRTRMIEPRQATGVWHSAAPEQTYYMNHAAYQPVVWDRETWLAECEARTRGTSGKKKGGIIGGLLGAIAGGIIGNRAWDSERLAGTAIGAVGGGLVGGIIGAAIGSNDGKQYYDCQEALDRYMSGAATTPRFASRMVGAPMMAGHATYAPMAYAYMPVYAQQYAYSEPMTYIEDREEIQQRVVVREIVTEEWVDEPARVPAQRLIKENPPVRPVPVKNLPTKLTPVKGY